MRLTSTGAHELEGLADAWPGGATRAGMLFYACYPHQQLPLGCCFVACDANPACILGGDAMLELYTSVHGAACLECSLPGMTLKPEHSGTSQLQCMQVNFAPVVV